MIDSLSELFKNSDIEENNCKGLVYRSSNCKYITVKNEICNKIMLRPLKKISCNGCKYCAGLIDCIKDVLDIDMSDFGHNKLYKLVWKRGGYCFEDNMYDYFPTFVEYNEK